MDLSAFKLDIDDLIDAFVKRELKTLADMKRIWLDRKFSYIFEARPSTNLALFMQSLFSHSISHLKPTNSLLRRLGGLYCVYCLYETQPFKPPFKIYISLGELRWMKSLVVDAKENGIKVVVLVVKKMLEKNSFLFGYVSVNEYSEKERIKELVAAQNACIQKMHEKLFANTEIERYLHMDMGMELDMKVLLKMSKEYAATKSFAVKEANEAVDVQNIMHIAEDRPTFGDEMRKIVEEWDNEQETFSQQTGPNQHRPERGNSHREQHMSRPENEQQVDDGDGEELHDNIGFLELLMGKDSPQGNGNIQHCPANQHPEEDDDDEFDFVKDLEDQLFEDVP